MRIFVVDDERVISWTVGIILSKHGYIADTFIDPLQALETATSEIPDLLISDVRMPGMSGIELAIQIRELRPQCRILLISGQAVVEDMLAGAIQRGYHFEILRKPIHPDVLLETIKKLAAERSQLKDDKQP